MAKSTKAANQIVRTVKVGVTVAPEHKEALEMRFRSYLYKPTLFRVGFLLGLSIFVNQYPTLKSPK